MKKLLLLSIIGITSICCADRFNNDLTTTEEIFTEFNENLIRISSQLQRLNDLQSVIIAQLREINNIASDYKVEYRSGIQTAAD